MMMMGIGQGYELGNVKVGGGGMLPSFSLLVSMMSGYFQGYNALGGGGGGDSAHYVRRRSSDIFELNSFRKSDIFGSAKFSRSTDTYWVMNLSGTDIFGENND